MKTIMALVLAVFVISWSADTQAGVCDPVTEGMYGLADPYYAAVYSSCTVTASGSEIIISMNYHPGGVITRYTSDPTYYIPPPTPTKSIGTHVANRYFSQDMGAGYTGNCLDMTGTLYFNPPAIAGHYYCFRMDGSIADLYLGGSLTDINTFINGTVTVVGAIPTASAVGASDVVPANAGETSWPVSVTYTDTDGDLDLASIDTNDISVCNAGNCATVTGTAVSGTAVSGTAASATVTYTITPPGGSWDAADNGTYTIAINANEVADSILDYVAADSNAGSFLVDATAVVTVPDAPTIGTAEPADSAAFISFTPPSNDGGAAIIDYTASCSAGVDATGPASPLTVTGLVNNTTYNCFVTARNSAGSSTPSATVPVTPSDGGGVTLPPSNNGAAEDVTFTYTATAADGVTAVPATLAITTTTPAPPAPPPAATSLVGAVDISSTSTADGFILVINLQLSASSKNEFIGYWKYGKEAPADTEHWYDYGTLASNANGTGYEISTDKKSMTIYLIDGLRGDDDLVVNASISDPALPVIQVAFVEPLIYKDGFEAQQIPH